MPRHTTYLAVHPKSHVPHLRVDVFYSLSGYNLFTYAQEERGYYLSVTPVGLSKGEGFTTEIYGAFSGIKQLLLPVSRQSRKRMSEALLKAADEQPRLVAHVLDKHGLELAA